MKIFIFFFLCMILFISCNESTLENGGNLIFSEDPVLRETQIFKIIEGPCGSITYKGRIGLNYDLALDSLVKIRMPFIDIELNGEEYYIDKDTIIVDFKYDERLFIAHGFRRIADNQYIFSITDVIDSKGNYFTINWCND